MHTAVQNFILRMRKIPPVCLNHPKNNPPVFAFQFNFCGIKNFKSLPAVFVSLYNSSTIGSHLIWVSWILNISMVP